MIRFSFIEDHRGVDDVKRMCALVEVPRSSFFDWASGPSAALQARQVADAELAVIIEQVWRESRRPYGWPRVWGQLTRRRGITVSRRRVHESGPSGIWFETRDAARAYLFEFIEVFYNRQRHQAGLGHLTPAEYAARFRERPYPRVRDPGSTPDRSAPG